MIESEARRQYKREHYLNNKAKYVASRQKIRIKKQQLIKEAKSAPCMDCGQSYPSYVMDFDHNGAAKLYAIASYDSSSLANLIIEIAKCDVVCSNCHRERTHGPVM